MRRRRRRFLFNSNTFNGTYYKLYFFLSIYLCVCVYEYSIQLERERERYLYILVHCIILLLSRMLFGDAHCSRIKKYTNKNKDDEHEERKIF